MSKKTGKEYLDIFNKIYEEDKFEYPDLEMDRTYRVVDFITIKCPKHGEFKRTITMHISKFQDCKECSMEKINKEKNKKGKDLLKNFNKIYGEDKFEYPDLEMEKYYKAADYITVKCPKHGEFKRKVFPHGKKFTDCIHCFRENKKDKRVRTGKEILEMFNKIYGEDKFEYPYLEMEKKYRYKDSIIVKCPKHGEFRRLIQSHVTKLNCRKCGQKNKKRRKDLFKGKNYLDIFNKIYDKENFTYPDLEMEKVYITADYITVKCPKHGEFRRTIMAHKGNAKCPKCVYKIKTGEEYLNLFNKIYGEDKFEYPDLEMDKEYIFADILKIECPKHGIFNRKIGHHLQNINCKKCSKNAMSDIETYTNNEIKKFFDTKQSNRGILKGKEIDIIISNINLGLEINGIYWHSNKSPKGKKDKNFVKFHQIEKFYNAKKENIFLLNFYEDEIRDKVKLNLILKELFLFNKSFKIENFDSSLLYVDKLAKNKFIKFFKSYSLEFINKEDSKFNGIFYNGYLLGVFSYNKETNIVNNYCINYNIDNNMDLKLIKEINPNFIFNIRNDSYNRFKFEQEEIEIIADIEPSYRNFNHKGKGKILNKRLEKIDPNHPNRIYDAGRILIKLL